MKPSPVRCVHLCAAGVVMALMAGLTATAGKPVTGAIAYPQDYREWSHVKSGLIDDPAHPAFPRFGGIHHIYANAAARDGLRSGHYPDGAIFAYDLLELRKMPDGTIDQGARRHVDVMLRDAKRFADTGGWGYEEFRNGDPGQPTLTAKARAGCHACHKSRMANGYVFSDWRQ
ncbi:MAG TPA: cytochrome P460 family protein [Lysobacter sp.]